MERFVYPRRGARSSIAAAMGDASFGIHWRVVFLCEAEPRWFFAHTGDVVDALAATALWSELTLVGAPRTRGRRFEGRAAIERALRGSVVLVSPRDGGTSLEREHSHVRVTIEPQDGALAMTLMVRDAALERSGPKALTDVADAVAVLTTRWRSHAQLVEAWCHPFRLGGEFRYPRARPPQRTHPFRPTGAIVDVLDAAFLGTPRTEAVRAATQAMVVATVPAGVTRTERDGVICLRWVDDPRDQRAVAAACGEHERWLLAIVPATRAPGWSPDGDERLDGHVEPGIAPFALVTHDTRDGRDLRHGYVEVEADDDGTITARAWEAVAPMARRRTLHDGTSLTEVRLLAPDRTTARVLVDRARDAGFDRVVYRDDGGALWDPDPPGPWLDDTSPEVCP